MLGKHSTTDLYPKSYFVFKGCLNSFNEFKSSRPKKL